MKFTAIDAEKDSAIDVTDNPDVASLIPKPYQISIVRKNLSPEELYKVFVRTFQKKIEILWWNKRRSIISRKNGLYV